MSVFQTYERHHGIHSLISANQGHLNMTRAVASIGRIDSVVALSTIGAGGARSFSAGRSFHDSEFVRSGLQTPR